MPTPTSSVSRPGPRRRAGARCHVERGKALVARGLMAPAGLAAFESRRESAVAYKDRPARLPAYETQLRAHPAAWRFFTAQPPSYRRNAIFWVASAAKAETRQRRLAMLIDGSTQGLRIGEILAKPR